MKKPIIPTLAGISGMVALTISFFRFKDLLHFEVAHFTIYGVIMAIMAISTYFYVQNARDLKRGIPIKDELSERLHQKTAFDTLPYTISIWVIILSLSFDSFKTVVSISIGIISMAMVYLVFWLLNKSKGLE